MIPFFSELDRRLFIAVAAALGTMATGWPWYRPEPPAVAVNVGPSTSVVAAVSPSRKEAAEEHDGLSLAQADAALSLSALLEMQRARRPVTETEEELHRQLLQAPTVGLEIRVRPRVPRAYRALGEPVYETVNQSAPPMAGLPFRSDSNCQVAPQAACQLQAVSRTIRDAMADPREEVRARLLRTALRRSSVEDKLETGYHESAVPALAQMWCSGDRFLNPILIDELARIPGKPATEALARICLFDPCEENRALALQRLGKRPVQECRPLLVEGLRHPWPIAANHAAIALVRLSDREAVPTLRRLAGGPDPQAPVRGPQGEYTVREMVRINHLRNCTVCHPPSTETTDLARGAMPDPTRELPPPTAYYQHNSGIFVRADITYLKQDFSVMLPVANPEPWPKLQRYDFMVRTRAATPEEVEGHRDRPADASYPQREAVLWALKEITARGIDASRER
jgi:hypothetical protein